MARNMEKLCGLIEDELRKVAEKGITTANLDNVYKLVDMMKDLKNMDYWETKSEYYEGMMDEGGYSEEGGGYSQGGYSERRRRDSRGRYSRAEGREGGNSYNDGGSSYRRGGYSRNQYSREGGGYSRNSEPDMERYDRYMSSKSSYRSSKSPECKQRMMDMLEDYMDDFTHKMEELARDSDCAEEKETIMRYLRKLQDIR